MWSINLLPGKSRVSRILMDDVFPKVMGPFTPKQQVINRIWSSKTQGASGTRSVRLQRIIMSTVKGMMKVAKMKTMESLQDPRPTGLNSSELLPIQSPFLESLFIRGNFPVLRMRYQWNVLELTVLLVEMLERFQTGF
ncbi:hypothetical protein WICPIJ_000491 [Wickerhamomyces pijperi]|uniref:Uncharacterized protein n=1 Tax=Wickerhamomyces pijperi TaxID=599730 RepID=A0A9P8QDN1_WICPI|nr:hypothetical protein WICPIJ_000491 [Wickerhamomyces pijperi]